MTDGVHQFDTGAIRDAQEGKPDLVETTSPWADWRYGLYMTEMKKKYGEGNFKKGIPRDFYVRGIARHFKRLQALDDCKTYGIPVEDWMEPEVDHAAALRFNVDGLMHEEEVAKAREKQDAEQIDKGLGYVPKSNPHHV